MPRQRLGFASAVLTLTLTSCVSPEELRREDEATCAGFGFHPGTDAFASRLQKESLAGRYYAARRLCTGVGVTGVEQAAVRGKDCGLGVLCRPLCVRRKWTPQV
jgi:hypothetical protein